MAEAKPNILVVDDELSIRESFSLILSKDYSLLLAASGEAALKKLIDNKVDLAFLDIRMPGMNGMETLKQMREIDQELDIIMVTAVNDIQNASEAITLGAKNYIVKPFDADEITKIAKTHTQKKATQDQVKTRRSKSSESNAIELIGQSKPIKELEKVINKISNKDLSVFICGKNGTEKELLAKILHSQSKRSAGPFRIFNIPINYSEDELRKQIFGWEKGNFVGDFKKEEGAFEKAHSGTLLINNIDYLNKNLQLELKKALEEKQYSRIGSMSVIPLEARLICSSSGNITELMNEGVFSREFFNFINEAYLELPDLKNRPGDIPILLSHFTEKYSEIFNKDITISKEALHIMTGYSWPGNNVELENTIKQLTLTAGKGTKIIPEDLPVEILINSSNTDNKYTNYEKIRKDFEKEYISKILKKTGNNKNKTAKILEVTPKILSSKLESLKD